jgi:hypothetical protein
LALDCIQYRNLDFQDADQMIPGFLQLNSMTNVNRHEMISLVKDALSKGGGYIIDFHMFSNAAICINFEISSGNIGDFYASLISTGLHLEKESCDLLADCSRQLKEDVEKAMASGVTGTLNITFIHNDPDLKIKVPPIPG